MCSVAPECKLECRTFKGRLNHAQHICNSEKWQQHYGSFDGFSNLLHIARSTLTKFDYENSNDVQQEDKVELRIGGFIDMKSPN